MKVKRNLLALVALISLSTIGSLSVTSVNPVQAKSARAVFPKKMRGTWYQFDKDANRIKKWTITKNKEIFYNKGKKSYLYLHAKPKYIPAVVKTTKKTKNWTYLEPVMRVRGRKWVTQYGWDQTAGAGAHYNVSKLKGHWVLTDAGGAGFWYSSHWYRSPKLAKKFKNRHYKGFAYDNIW
ncbi:hypothetical protein [Lactobacillus xylocopicola]|uniref:Surface layer protein A domain-containing protein n=1 Tax=Lactobacillus xylocopicola TaxID=2976676 RepID=A0ABM8BFJ4_9LACO|nr:hypothetical protein [Lactobacillus xylocopicola]BDR60026.1 hypothetical protein KIM322_02870 [Lactobacillus xylocopicola]